MKEYIEKLVNKEDLSLDEMMQATNHCLTNKVSPAEIAAFLIALRSKGETINEITGIVNVIRSQSPLGSIKLQNVMDNCGTGGDNSHSFNISTTASFVIAGAGVTVAKHGNRSVSSQTGSADVLGCLGVSLFLKKSHVEQLLHENKIAFLYAPHIHKNLQNFMKVRIDLGLPTIFNTIGPLTNPIHLDSQFIGVYKQSMISIVARALNKLGRQRAIVVNGAGGMDEASLAGENKLTLLDNEKITSFTLHPEELGLPTYPLEAIQGGDAKTNAKILLAVLKGEKGPYLDTTLLNAALGLYANGVAETLKDGLVMARESIQSGKALERLNHLISYSNKVKGEVI